MPVFSIIIPTYNRAHYLKQCLSSVLSQKFEDWECIVIDDGSTDTTESVVQEFVKEDDRFVYHFQVNAERCAARNKGISLASGNYICFLDSDDTYTDDHLDGLQQQIEQVNDPVMFFTNFKINGVDQGKMKALPEHVAELTYYLLSNSIIPDRVCIHKSILEEFQFDKDITVGEDMMLWARIAQNFPLVAVEQSTVMYALHEDNTIHLKNDSAEKLLLGLKKYFTRYPEILKQLRNADLKVLYSNIYFNLAKHHLYHWNRLCAFKAIVSSLVLNWKQAQKKYKLNLLVKLIKGDKAFVDKELEQLK